MRTTYDWKAFDERMRELARELTCTEVVTRAGLAPRGAGERSQFTIRCPCPGHGDSKPSCSIREQSWKCFGCGAQGDVLDLLGVLEGLEDFAAKVRRALELRGMSYDAEREVFLERSRQGRPWRAGTHSTPPVASARVHARGKKAPVPRPHPEDTEMLMAVLSRLELDDAAVDYLEARGVPGAFARAHGLLSATYEQWSLAIERTRAHFGQQAVERAGLLSRQGRAHPFIERMLIFPYHGEQGPIGLRVRRLSHDATYGGARYMGRRHGHNRVRAPYLGSRWGWPQGVSPRHGLIWLTEGEIDTLSLRALGRASLGVPGAQALEADWVESWSHARGVVVLRDADTDAMSASAWLAHEVERACTERHGSRWVRDHLHVRVVQGAKDPNELLVGGRLDDFLNTLEREITRSTAQADT